MPCPSNCSFCTVGNCLKCSQSFYLSKGSCFQCHNSCLECSGPESFNCQACKDPSIKIINQTGLCECPSGTYISSFSPLVCDKCPKNCKDCKKSICLSCIQGFSIKSEVCSQNLFYLKIEVLANDSVKLKFSEELLTVLDENQVKIFKSNNGKVKFKIAALKMDLYLLKIDDYGSISDIETIYLKFENLLSKNLSLLDELEYTYVLNNALSPFLRSISSGVVNTIVVAGISSSIINSNDPYIWVSVNTIQLLSYTPLLNIKFPRFLERFLIELRPLSIIEFPWLNDKIFQCNTNDINPRFYFYGFSCKNFLNISVEVFLSFAGGIVVAFILIILNFIPNFKIKSFCSLKLKSYKYAFFIRFWIQAYIELLIPSVISINFVIFN